MEILTKILSDEQIRRELAATVLNFVSRQGVKEVGEVSFEIALHAGR